MGICKHVQYRNSTKIPKQSTSYYSQRTVVRPKHATAYRPRHLPSTLRNHEHQPQIQGQANGSPT
jgi:hypothetical protein